MQLIDCTFNLQKSGTANTTTIAAKASTRLTVSSSGTSASSSSSLGCDPIQMRLCFSQDGVRLRKPSDNVCELELDINQ